MDMKKELIAALEETPMRVPSFFLYDDIGSAYFAKLSDCEDYYLKKAEFRLLQREASSIIAESRNAAIVELGCGNGDKLYPLLEALTSVSPPHHYIGIDINDYILRKLKEKISVAFPKLDIQIICSDFHGGLKQVNHTSASSMFLFLGSNLSNLTDKEATDLFSSIAQSQNTDHFILLGVDLVKDDDRKIVKAYKDDFGLNDLFALHCLKNLNEWMQANFDISKFKYEVSFDRDDLVVRPNIVSTAEQVVTIGAIDKEYKLQPGDVFQIGQMRKFHPQQVEDVMGRSGYTLQNLYLDDGDHYGLFLFRNSR